MAIDAVARGLAVSNSGGGGGSTNISQGVGIEITGVDTKTISNAGVTDIKLSDDTAEDGTIKVVIAGSERKSKNVKVKGLNDAAYKKVDTVIDSSTKTSTNLVTTKAVSDKLDGKLDADKWKAATTTESGIMTPEDKVKVNAVEIQTEESMHLEIDALFSGFDLPPLDPDDDDGIANQSDIEEIFDPGTVDPEPSGSKQQGQIVSLDSSEIDDIFG